MARITRAKAYLIRDDDGTFMVIAGCMVKAIECWRQLLSEEWDPDDGDIEQVFPNSVTDLEVESVLIGELAKK